jgi:transposase
VVNVPTRFFHRQPEQLSIMNMHLQEGATHTMERPNAGIDVSKLYVDVHWRDQARRWSNDAQGWNELTAQLLSDKVDLVVIEATGGYERGLVLALQQAGMEVARVNPRQARDFAKSLGRLDKTDRLDAQGLRDFADVLARHPKRQRYITARQDPHRQKLLTLMTRRRQLVDMRVAEVNRLELADEAIALKSIRSVIKLLDQQLAQIDREIDGHLEHHFKAQRKLLERASKE